ncbi:discoidin domain-containing protein [bacterium]|nr:discoidin domain-containing protein [bacterium]
MRPLACAFVLLLASYLAGEENLLRSDSVGFFVRVDSSFAGYSAQPLTDGIVYLATEERGDHPLGALGDAANAWHSGDSSGPHWIELTFADARPLERIDVWWGPERLWPRAFRLEAWDGQAWRTLAGGEEWRAAESQHTRILLRGLAAPKLRLVQRAGGGGRARPTAMCAVEVAVGFAHERPGARCFAGTLDYPALSPALSDERLLTTAPLSLRDGRPQGLHFLLPQAQPVRQVVFDFLVYDGDDFAPQGETHFYVHTGGDWVERPVARMENWVEATALGPTQRMGRVRWIYDLSGQPILGARLTFSQGRERAVVATGMAAFREAPLSAAPRPAEYDVLPATDANLLEVAPWRLYLELKGQARPVAWPPTLHLERRPQRLSVRFAHPKMISRLELAATHEYAFDCTPELFLEGAPVHVPRITLERSGAMREWSLSPSSVDRIDFVLASRTASPITLAGIFAGMHEDGLWALSAIEDSPRDLWMNRLLAAGEPNYLDAAALMLPRRGHRSVIGAPNDGDETAVSWNGVHFLRRRDDPRAEQVSRFFAFRLDGEDFGAQPERLTGGWTDGQEELRPGALPERWLRYEKDGVAATLRSFTGIADDGRGNHRLHLELAVENLSRESRRGALEAVTGVVRWGQVARLGILNQLPLPDAPSTPDGRLLVDEYGQPVFLTDTPFELAGTPEEPAVRWNYTLKPGARTAVHLCALVDGPVADATLAALPPLGETRRAFRESWTARLNSGLRITLPESRLVLMADKFLSDCLIIPDHGRPLYGSYFYEDTFGVEEGWPIAALARWGFFPEAQEQVQYLLTLAADDRRSRHKQYRKGLAPMYAWNVYELSRDADYLARILPAMQSCADEIIADCRTTLRRHEGRPVGYYGLLPRHTYGGDVAEPAYSIYANACAWRGLRDTGLACGAAGLAAEARRYLAHAETYRAHILAAVDRIMDASADPPFVPFSMGYNSPDPAEPFPAGDPTPSVLSQDRLAAYWGLFAGLILETRLFPPKSVYTESILATMLQRGGLWCGQARFALDASDWDPHYGYGLHQMWFERGEKDRFLSAFYGFIAHDLSRDTWVHGEVSSVFPERTENFAEAAAARRRIWRQRDYKNSEPIGSGAGLLLCEIRDLLVCEGRDESGALDGSLQLLRNAPVAWWMADRQMGVERAPTAYGRLSYRVRPQYAGGRIKLDLMLDGETPVRVRVHFPPPPGCA